MTEPGDHSDRQAARYIISAPDAQGLAIGGGAQVVQNVYAAPPPPSISRDDWLAAIYEAGSVLRLYRNTIAGIAIGRAEVAQIGDWALNAEPKERLGMLLDQPGGGKTVVMRGVLEYLEATGVPVLAIKADTLSGIKTPADLVAWLRLPAAVEACARSLALEGRFVVLLDQLDALSLTLSRDQTTLNVMLDALARLRAIPGVRMIASCRTFDLNNNPQLSAITTDRTFRLQPLTEDQVDPVLRAIGIDPTRLLPAHRALLSVPLHLDVYARVVVSDAHQGIAESFHTLQELYAALWQQQIMAIRPSSLRPQVDCVGISPFSTFAR
ncbi:MAG: AAA family ATPase [Ardenticatenaceae bacterium]|nr:AAA family ATPase [Ardenticatenaceae bacterium]